SWANGMRLVALSGWAQESDRQKSREAGFDVHLAKPVTFGVLMDALGSSPVADGDTTAPRQPRDGQEAEGDLPPA
ncbi:MAG: hypothetical protein ACT4P6_21435, partial [Gemmatimonadaceae bacterium]